MFKFLQGQPAVIKHPSQFYRIFCTSFRQHPTKRITTFLPVATTQLLLFLRQMDP